MRPFRSEALDNGVAITFFDLSNRYFGDYYRVRVEVRISVPQLGQSLVKVHMLDRMGVPGADVSGVRTRLVEDFWRNAGAYLGRPDYPARLLAAASPLRRAPLDYPVHSV